MHRVFARWNEGELSSYLIEITTDILAHKDEDDSPLIDNILDVAGQKQTSLRRILAAAITHGIPAPCHASAINYYDGYRIARLPANLLQAQRDYFGAHTYERIDKPRGEFFHTNWTGEGGDTTSTAYIK